MSEEKKLVASKGDERKQLLETLSMSINKMVDGQAEVMVSTNLKEEKKTHYTAFGGSDCIVMINGEVEGALENIGFAAPYKMPGEKVPVQMDFTVFNKDPLEKLRKKTYNEITIDFSNEYGTKAHMKINNAQLMYEESAFSIDDVCFTYKAMLAADSITPIKEGRSEAMEARIKKLEESK